MILPFLQKLMPLLFVRTSPHIFAALGVNSNVADREIHHAALDKLTRSLSQLLYISEFELPFWVISVLK